MGTWRGGWWREGEREIGRGGSVIRLTPHLHPNHLGPGDQPKLKWTLQLFVILKALVRKASVIGCWSVRKSAYRSKTLVPLSPELLVEIQS